MLIAEVDRSDRALPGVRGRESGDFGTESREVLKTEIRGGARRCLELFVVPDRPLLEPLFLVAVLALDWVGEIGG